MPSLASLGAPETSPAGPPVETKVPAGPIPKSKRLVMREDHEDLARFRAKLREFGCGMGRHLADFNETGLDAGIQTSRLERLRLYLEILEYFRSGLLRVKQGFHANASAFPPRDYFHSLSQIQAADALLKELSGHVTVLASTRLGRLRLGEEVGKAIQALTAAHPEYVERSQRAIQDRAAEEAIRKRQGEVLACARRERLQAGRERKVEAKQAKAVFEQSRKELEGKLREPTPEDLQADKDFEALVEADRQHLRRKFIEACRSSSSSSSSSSSTSSSSPAPSPDAGPQARPVRWLPEAWREDFSERVVKDHKLRMAINLTVAKLAKTGRLSGSKQVAPEIYELRPCGGQSTWRPLYTLYEGEFIILGLTRESVENPSAFRGGLLKATARMFILKARAG